MSGNSNLKKSLVVGAGVALSAIALNPMTAQAAEGDAVDLDPATEHSTESNLPSLTELAEQVKADAPVEEPVSNVIPEANETEPEPVVVQENNESVADNTAAQNNVETSIQAVPTEEPSTPEPTNEQKAQTEEKTETPAVETPSDKHTEDDEIDNKFKEAINEIGGNEDVEKIKAEEENFIWDYVANDFSGANFDDPEPEPVFVEENSIEDETPTDDEDKKEVTEEQQEESDDSLIDNGDIEYEVPEESTNESPDEETTEEEEQSDDETPVVTPSDEVTPPSNDSPAQEPTVSLPEPTTNISASVPTPASTASIATPAPTPTVSIPDEEVPMAGGVVMGQHKEAAETGVLGARRSPETGDAGAAMAFAGIFGSGAGLILWLVLRQRHEKEQEEEELTGGAKPKVKTQMTIVNNKLCLELRIKTDDGERKYVLIGSRLFGYNGQPYEITAQMRKDIPDEDRTVIEAYESEIIENKNDLNSFIDEAGIAFA